MGIHWSEIGVRMFWRLLGIMGHYTDNVTDAVSFVFDVDTVNVRSLSIHQDVMILWVSATVVSIEC